VKQLQRYHDLLATTAVQWGLIGPREVDRLWDRHLDNSVAVTEDFTCLPEGSSVIDVGSGAGLPGIVWAIARPDLHIVCVEPMARRCRFLEEAVEALQLHNVDVIRGRAESLNQQADRVTARAVARMEILLPWIAPLVAPGGAMVLLKGDRAADEISQARPWLRTHGWQAQMRFVGTPTRTRVVVVDRSSEG
jgi:16S rRNA (guanine527-N7)-methyltransferase